MTKQRGYGTGHIEQRGPETWLVQIELPRGADGQRSRQRLTVHGSKRDAERAVRDVLHQRDHGMTVAPNRLLVGEWLPEWLERRNREGRKPIADSTSDRYRRVIATLPRSFAALRLQDVRPAHLATLYADESLTADARRKLHVILRHAFMLAFRQELLSRNVMDAVSPPLVQKNAEQRVLNESELKALVAAAIGTAHEVPIKLTIATGLREGELLALAWTDIDLARGTLSVRRGARYLNGRGMQFTEPKTPHARRVLELSAPTVRLLHQHRAAQAALRIRRAAVWEDGGLVFPSAIGTPWIPRNFYRGYRTILTASAIEHPETVSWHTLRHSAATWWLRAGADLHTVSRRLGHASAAFTLDTYGHLLAGMQRQAAEAADALIG